MNSGVQNISHIMDAQIAHFLINAVVRLLQVLMAFKCHLIHSGGRVS